MNRNAQDAPSEGPGPRAPDSESSDEALARAATRGDIRAFESLMARYYPSVRRVILARIPDQAEADDLCQDVFLKVYQKLGGLNDPARFKPWLFRLALNRIRDHLRRFRIRSWWVRPLDSDRNGIPEPAAQDEDGLQTALKREFWNQVRKFIGNLAPREAEVFVLRYIQDLSIREIADTLGRDPGTVKTHLHRAVRKFKTQDFPTFHPGGTKP